MNMYLSVIFHILFYTLLMVRSDIKDAVNYICADIQNLINKYFHGEKYIFFN